MKNPGLQWLETQSTTWRSSLGPLVLRTIVCVSLFVPSASAEARPRAIKVEIPGEGTFTFIFDPAKVSAQTLREVALLSPEGPHAGLALAWPVETCSNDHPQYLPCGDKTPAAPNFLRNAEVNVARNTKRAGEIEALRPPPELQSIKTYLLRLANFSAGFERGRLEFARSGDLTNLIAVTQSIAGTSCDEVIGGIAGMESRVTQWAEIRDKAWNCAMSAFRKRFGEYPDSAWYSFLESRNVTAEFNSAIRN